MIKVKNVLLFNRYNATKLMVFLVADVVKADRKRIF